MLALAFAAALALVAALVTGGVSWVLGSLGFVPLTLVAMAASRVPLSASLRLTDRQVVLERRRLLHQQRTTLRLDELDVVDLTDPPELGGTGQIVLRAGHDVIVFGRDLPREHNAWFVAAIEAARAVVARREGREGREYSFLRRPPEAVEVLRETPDPDLTSR